MEQILTSESVNIGHPDKTCDYIADCFLDEALSQDKNSQMAVECAIKSNHLFIYGEATTSAKINYSKIARDALKKIGYKQTGPLKQLVKCLRPEFPCLEEHSLRCPQENVGPADAGRICIKCHSSVLCPGYLVSQVQYLSFQHRLQAEMAGRDQFYPLHDPLHPLIFN